MPGMTRTQLPLAPELCVEAVRGTGWDDTAPPDLRMLGLAVSAAVSAFFAALWAMRRHETAYGWFGAVAVVRLQPDRDQPLALCEQSQLAGAGAGHLASPLRKALFKAWANRVT